LLEWIREFNQHRDRQDAVHVHGIDIQHPRPAADRIHSYLAAAAPDILEKIQPELGRLQEGGLPDFQDEAAVGRDLEARETVITTLREYFEDTDGLQDSDGVISDTARTRRFVWLLDQGRRQFQAIHDGRASEGANVRIRDSAMAAQVQWLLRHSPAEQIAVWGHNAHLTRGAFGDGTVRHAQGIPSLGQNLSRLSGLKYYALSLSLGGGVVGATYLPDGTFRAYEIGEPRSGSIPAVLSTLD
jgi:erythromycin esterase